MKSAWFSTNAAGIAAGLAMLVAGTAASAQQRTLVYMNSGGVLLEAERAAFIEPFEKATGIKVVTVSPVDMAKIQTMVRVGQTNVDVVQWNPEQVVVNCGKSLENIRADIDVSVFQPQYVVSECGVPAATFIHTFFYKKSAFPQNPPKSWADFFDTTKFPGKRAVWNSGLGTNYEQALLADGIAPKDLYPLDFDKALAKWGSIRGDLQFWSTPAQLVQLMQEGSVPLISGWGPAATQAIIKGAEYQAFMGSPIYLFNQYMVPKGAPNKAEAIEFIKFVTSAESQTRLVSSYPEGPTRIGIEPKEFANPILEANYVGKGLDSPGTATINPSWRLEHQDEMAKKWTDWATR